ncbi:MAG: hypothetical protein ABI665_22330 [Vicinamibacterales bacterium]
MRSLLFGASVLIGALVSSGCGSNSPTAPTAPEVVTTTETFSGSININGAATHSFFTTVTGTVTATLTGLDPAETATIGLSLGTWNGISCNIIIASDKAVLTQVVTGTVSTTAGSLCVRVYDTGSLIGPTNYEVQVVHP